MRKLTEIYGGALLYHRITHKNPETFFILLTDRDNELNYYAICHLQECAKIKRFSSVGVICNEELIKTVTHFLNYDFKIYCLTEKKLNQLVSYVLLKMTNCYDPIIDNMRLISLSETHTGTDLLYKIGFFDKEYIVWNRLLFRGTAYEFIRVPCFSED